MDTDLEEALRRAVKIGRDLSPKEAACLWAEIDRLRRTDLIYAFKAGAESMRERAGQEASALGDLLRASNRKKAASECDMLAMRIWKLPLPKPPRGTRHQPTETSASTLHRIEFRETGADRGGPWATFAETTKHPDPTKVARRYIRLVNHLANKPGGYDQVLAAARVYRVGLWPGGDTFVKEIRVRSPRPKRKPTIASKAYRTMRNGMERRPVR